MFSFLVLSSLLLQASAECPEGWWRAGESCYTTSQQPMTWFNAQELCWSLGGYLAEIESQEHENLLDTYLIDGVIYWIGLSDFSVEGKFQWSESHAVAQYTNWWPGQPNNAEGENGGEDCVFKSLRSGYEGWDDYFCEFSEWNYWGIHALCMMSNAERKNI